MHTETQEKDSTKHTLGPLTIAVSSPGLDRGIDDGGDFAIVDVNGHVIGQAHQLVAPGVMVPAKANATLWAAAPELLAALERALTTTQEIERVTGQRHYNPGTLQKMANAIKAAKS